MKALPAGTRWVIVGSGFAGASTAWALARAGLGPGVILEREPAYGVHASGRNAGLLRVAEHDEVIRTLAARSAAVIREFAAGEPSILSSTGGLTLVSAPALHEVQAVHDAARARRTPVTELLTAAAARSRFPLIDPVRFDAALWCAEEGVVDIHALLTRFLAGAREGGFELHTRCEAEELAVAGGGVEGVQTTKGEIRADAVVDASGAWAGRLGREARPLPLRPLRRHLFVTGAPPGRVEESPYAWVEDAGFYFRPEGDGLLFSPCDETEMPPGDPPTDPGAAELLASKLERHAPLFSDLPLRRGWACLRTFAPDRRPLIGWDPARPGLFHVSGLGGFGMGSSAAIGELAATLLRGRTADWIDVREVDVARVAPEG